MCQIMSIESINIIRGIKNYLTHGYRNSNNDELCANHDNNDWLWTST